MTTTLQVIASPEMGGAEVAFIRTVEALRRAHHPTDCVLRGGSKLAAQPPGGVPAQTLGMRNYFDFVTAFRLRTLLKNTHYDVVQTWMTRATWLTRAPKDTCHIARLGGYYDFRKFRHADAWMVNTQGLYRAMASAGFPTERLVHINNFVPAPGPSPIQRASLGIPEDALVVVALGRLVTHKGFDVLIHAMKRLPAAVEGRPLHLVVMGEGPLQPALTSLAAELGPRVHFTGWLTQANHALAIGDLFVCPSQAEPLGNVILEAWNMGLPVISTATAGGLELIAPDHTGLLVPVDDATSMAAAISKLLQSKTLRAELAGAGNDYFGRHFSEQATVNAYADFYQRMTAKQPKRTS